VVGSGQATVSRKLTGWLLYSYFIRWRTLISETEESLLMPLCFVFHKALWSLAPAELTEMVSTDKEALWVQDHPDGWITVGAPRTS
jgi:hypothetical protein